VFGGGIQLSVVVVYVTASFLTVRVHGVIVTVFVVKVGLPLILLVPVAMVDNARGFSSLVRLQHRPRHTRHRDNALLTIS
jgi:hypothetical protein